MLFQNIQLLEKKLSCTFQEVNIIPLALSQGSLWLFVPIRPDFSNLNFSCWLGLVLDPLSQVPLSETYAMESAPASPQ